MSKALEIHVDSPKTGTCFPFYGTFTNGLEMPWGPWKLTSKPKALFKVGDITVLECFASERVEDEQGCVAESTIAYNPCARYFIIGRKTDGEVVWWHSLVAEYDLENRRFREGSITLEGNQVIVKGYGDGGGARGKTVRIDAETGLTRVLDIC